MEDVAQTTLVNWHLFLQSVSNEMDVYVPVDNNIHIEYKLYRKDSDHIRYNIPLPVSPLKVFLLPVKENVNKEKIHNKKLIVGVPSCDLHALNLLDEIYLDEKLTDSVYKRNRDNTIIIGADCVDIREHCHCTSYGVNPYPEVNADIGMVVINDQIIFSVKTEKGKALLDQMKSSYQIDTPAPSTMKKIEDQREKITEKLILQNKGLPDYKSTFSLVRGSKDEVWERHSKTCVSCGACATICPTCTCFLLIDRPDFEKVRQMDACQYPGFERIAAGEDPLAKKHVRFRNRYMCKYVWKPEKFKSTACTGCGRCIDSCIGNINKNEIFKELAAT